MLGLHWCVGFSLLMVSGDNPLVAECRIPLLRSMGSREHRFNSSGTWAYLLCGMPDSLGSGSKPVPPALAGEFLITEPPGKPKSALKNRFIKWNNCPWRSCISETFDILFHIFLQAISAMGWFQDLMKLRFLMAECRKNPVRDKVCLF